MDLVQKMSPEDVTAILNSLQVYGGKEGKPINTDILQVLKRLSIVKLEDPNS